MTFRVLIITLLLTATAYAKSNYFQPLCEEARQEYIEAKKFGAYKFRCKENYDGSMVSSFKMSNKNWKRWRESQEK